MTQSFLPLLIDAIRIVEHIERSAHCALRVILMRLRKTKADDDAITDVWGDMTGVAGNDICARALVSVREVSECLRIELLRMLCRSEEIANRMVS